jgi:hypothetical protein
MATEDADTTEENHLSVCSAISVGIASVDSVG